MLIIMWKSPEPKFHPLVSVLSLPDLQLRTSSLLTWGQKIPPHDPFWRQLKTHLFHASVWPLFIFLICYSYVCVCVHACMYVVARTCDCLPKCLVLCMYIHGCFSLLFVIACLELFLFCDGNSAPYKYYYDYYYLLWWLYYYQYYYYIPFALCVSRYEKQSSDIKVIKGKVRSIVCIISWPLVIRVSFDPEFLQECPK